jgi:thiamine-phosphate pyrophosphorylase
MTDQAPQPDSYIDDALALDPAFADRFGHNRRGPCLFYLISPPHLDLSFVDRLTSALDGGPVTAFQFRVKDVDQHEAARLAEPLRRLCADRDVAFIVNDDMSLAKRLGADGVHLGQDDGDPADARRLLGPEAQIGVTCHASRHLAMEAAEAGADYVAFGAFFDTPTKPTEHRADPALLSWWSTVSEIPCVAIGGITVERAPAVVKAGADFIAVSSGVWQWPKGPEDAVRAFVETLKR